MFGSEIMSEDKIIETYTETGTRYSYRGAYEVTRTIGLTIIGMKKVITDWSESKKEL
jgi:hypothetical protein